MGVMDRARQMVMGPESEASDPQAVSGDSGAVDATSVREEAREARKPRRDKGTRRGPRRVASGEDVTDEEIQALFEAENWEALASLYFDTRFVMTGYENFRLTEPERKRLSQTMATTMKVLLKIDPAYIAVVVFTVNYGGIIAAKEAAFSNHRRQETAARRATSTPRLTPA